MHTLNVSVNHMIAVYNVAHFGPKTGLTVRVMTGRGSGEKSLGGEGVTVHLLTVPVILSAACNIKDRIGMA